MTTTKDRLFELIRSVLFQGADPELDSKFIEDLDADPADVSEIFTVVQEEFGVEISDEDAAEVETVRQLLELVEEKEGK